MPVYKSIVFTDEQAAYCVEEGRKRAIASAPYANRRNWTGLSDIEKETIGVWGEYGLHIMFGCPYFDTLRPDGNVDGRFGDTILDTYWIDAKTMKDRFGEMYLKMWRKPIERITCDLFALLYSDGKRVDFYGFISKNRFITRDNFYLDHPFMHMPGWIVSEEQLVPTIKEEKRLYAHHS